MAWMAWAASPDGSLRHSGRPSPCRLRVVSVPNPSRAALLPVYAASPAMATAVAAVAGLVAVGVVSLFGRDDR